MKRTIIQRSCAQFFFFFLIIIFFKNNRAETIHITFPIIIQPLPIIYFKIHRSYEQRRIRVLSSSSSSTSFVPDSFVSSDFSDLSFHLKKSWKI